MGLVDLIRSEKKKLNSKKLHQMLKKNASPKN